MARPFFRKVVLMEIDFYQNTSDKRVMNKTIGTAVTFSNCELIEPCGVLNPTFTIDRNESLYMYNYVYIPKYSRYYFIDEIIVNDGISMIVKCSVDPLMSWKTQLLNCDINSRCNENNYDMYLPDNRPIESRYIRYSKKFSKSFEDFTPSYILITVGNGDMPLYSS